tara:strand:+ start:240 stop:440 length:201 start_codon:yes stop_codon:yes gene_type:complete
MEGSITMSTPLHHGCECEHCQSIAETYDLLEAQHKTIKNTKGKRKPQAIRQAKAKLKAFINSHKHQ